MKPAFICQLLFASGITLLSCTQESTALDALLMNQMSLKRGELITCGPADQQLGSVAFSITGTRKENRDFDLGVKLLHLFEYDKAEKVFAGIIDAPPQCAMAYWGVAMSNLSCALGSIIGARAAYAITYLYKAGPVG
jgi:hypothetical protein